MISVSLAYEPPISRQNTMLAPLPVEEVGLTPGITRRPEPLRVDEILRVGGRVHAVVSPRVH